MNIDFVDFPPQLMLAIPIVAIFMLGNIQIRATVIAYALQTTLLALLTAKIGLTLADRYLLFVAAAIFVLKACFIPWFLIKIKNEVDIDIDRGSFLPPPIAMHLSLGLLGLSFWLSETIPSLANHIDTRFGTTAALSLVLSGILLMLTRRLAISQIVGFLVMENGIYLFGLTLTHGMPLFIEMGILLDMLVGVMIGGLLVFRIKKSFEHIDVSRLNELAD